MTNSDLGSPEDTPCSIVESNEDLGVIIQGSARDERVKTGTKRLELEARDVGNCIFNVTSNIADRIKMAT